MATRTTSQKKIEWQHHFTAQKKSGLSRAEYCRIHNIGYDNFYYHHKKYQSEREAITDTGPEPNRQPSSDFISLELAPTPTSPKQTSLIELSLQRQDETLTIKVNWTPNELLSFISSWKAE